MRFTIYDENGEQMRKLWDKEAAQAYIRYREGWYFIESKKLRKPKFELSQFEEAPF